MTDSEKLLWLANEADSADSYVCWDMSVLSISDLRRVAKALPLLAAVATSLDKDVPEYYRNRPWETAPCEVGAGLFKKAHEALAALKGDAP